MKAVHDTDATSVGETKRGLPPRVNLKSTWGQPGVNLGSTWGQPGVILGSTWGHPGVILGSTWGHPGVNLGSSWGHPGVSLHRSTLKAAAGRQASLSSRISPIAEP
jgi:hypothetical protein